MLTAKELQQYITQQQIDARIVFLEEATPTVQHGRDAGHDPDSIGKSVLFWVDTQPCKLSPMGYASLTTKSWPTTWAVVAAAPSWLRRMRCWRLPVLLWEPSPLSATKTALCPP